MRGFYENAVLGGGSRSVATAAPTKRGPPAIFIGGGELEKVMMHSHEDDLSYVGAARLTAVRCAAILCDRTHRLDGAKLPPSHRNYLPKKRRRAAKSILAETGARF
jgi:hypothetical protein